VQHIVVGYHCQQRSNIINPTVLIRCLASDRVFCFCVGDAVYFPPDHGPGGRTTRRVVVAAGVQVCDRDDDRRPKSCLYRLQTLLIVRHPAIKSEYLQHTPYPHTCDNLSSYAYFCSPTPCLLCPYLSPKKKPSTLYEKRRLGFAHLNCRRRRSPCCAYATCAPPPPPSSRIDCVQRWLPDGDQVTSITFSPVFFVRIC